MVGLGLDSKERMEVSLSKEWTKLTLGPFSLLLLLKKLHVTIDLVLFITKFVDKIHNYKLFSNHYDTGQAVTEWPC